MRAESLVTVDQLNLVLADTAFLKSYGFTVQSCAWGECTLLVPFNASLERPGGIVSGMTIMGASDVAMWLAIMTQRGRDEQWVTSDMKTACPAQRSCKRCTLHRAHPEAWKKNVVWRGGVSRGKRCAVGASCHQLCQAVRMKPINQPPVASAC